MVANFNKPKSKKTKKLKPDRNSDLSCLFKSEIYLGS